MYTVQRGGIQVTLSESVWSTQVSLTSTFSGRPMAMTPLPACSGVPGPAAMRLRLQTLGKNSEALLQRVSVRDITPPSRGKEHNMMTSGMTCFLQHCPSSAPQAWQHAAIMGFKVAIVNEAMEFRLTCSQPHHWRFPNLTFLW